MDHYNLIKLQLPEEVNSKLDHLIITSKLLDYHITIDKYIKITKQQEIFIFFEYTPSLSMKFFVLTNERDKMPKTKLHSEQVSIKGIINTIKTIINTL